MEEDAEPAAKCQEATSRMGVRLDGKTRKMVGKL